MAPIRAILAIAIVFVSFAARAESRRVPFIDNRDYEAKFDPFKEPPSDIELPVASKPAPPLHDVELPSAAKPAPPPHNIELPVAGIPRRARDPV